MRIKFFIFFLSFWFWGCAALFKSESAKTPEAEQKDFLDKYEKTFNPADYDDDVEKEENENETKNFVGTKRGETDKVEPEIISGFRIQILMTSEIDEANAMKNQISPLLQYDWVYMIHEAPYYKIRAGDFPYRASANHLLKFLIDSGYKNAWVVPDKVYKSPPPKPKEPVFETE
ncbi:MAG: SPOR domain-containing protein [Bacteroidota bacterium]|nr:SPOR domain-containing protein [Bacteroidota bacterium]